MMDSKPNETTIQEDCAVVKSTTTENEPQKQSATQSSDECVPDIEQPHEADSALSELESSASAAPDTQMKDTGIWNQTEEFNKGSLNMESKKSKMSSDSKVRSRTGISKSNTKKPKSKAQLSEDLIVDSDDEALPKSVDNDEPIESDVVQADRAHEGLSTIKPVAEHHESQETLNTEDEQKNEERIANPVQKLPCSDVTSDRDGSEEVSVISESSLGPAKITKRSDPQKKEEGPCSQGEACIDQLCASASEFSGRTQGNSVCRYTGCCCQSDEAISKDPRV